MGLVLGVAATDGRLIQPLDEPTKARLEVDWEETKQTAIARRPEIRRAMARVKERTSELLAAREQLLTKIDAEALHRLIGSEDGMDSKRIPGKSAELTEDELAEWRSGFMFQMPLGLRAELAQLRNSQLRLRRSEKLLDEIKLDVTHQLSAAPDADGAARGAGAPRSSPSVLKSSSRSGQ